MPLACAASSASAIFDPPFQHLLQRQRSAFHAMFQCRAVQILHDDEGSLIFLVNFMDRTYVGVIQGRGGLGFALEASEDLRVSGHIVREEFQGDEAIEFNVFGLVHDAQTRPPPSFSRMR